MTVSEKAVSIHEMLAMVPAEDLRIQFLHECASDYQKTKRGTRVSFCTSELTPASIMDDSAPVGVVIWIKRTDWKRVVEALKGGAK